MELLLIFRVGLFGDFFLRTIGCNVGSGAIVNMRQYIMSPSRLEIGAGSHINQGCVLDCRGSIKIGTHVSISHRVSVFTASHNPQSKEFEYRDGPVEIEDYVWIGANATILGPVKIGKGSVVAAGAVVTHDVSPFEIVAGVPAKKIGERSHDVSYECRWPYRFT